MSPLWKLECCRGNRMIKCPIWGYALLKLDTPICAIYPLKRSPHFVLWSSNVYIPSPRTVTILLGDTVDWFVTTFLWCWNHWLASRKSNSIFSLCIVMHLRYIHQRLRFQHNFHIGKLCCKKIQFLLFTREVLIPIKHHFQYNRVSPAEIAQSQPLEPLFKQFATDELMGRIIFPRWTDQIPVISAV